VETKGRRDIEIINNYYDVRRRGVKKVKRENKGEKRTHT
jgi:hypothetical protein|tara:strand:- start:446 stop:562 length:117 start_codon:yes stop_codon:yes gene_type:complete